jgi:quercetin dioxygenase-like cupin family protein
MEFEIQFDKPVVVVGLPSLPLAIGVALREGKYLRGSGGKSLTFQVIPAPGDQAPGGVRLLNALLTIDGSSIKSRSGKPADLTLPEVRLKHVVVNDPSPAQDICRYSTSINGELPPLLATFAKSSEIASDVIMTAGEGLARRALVIKTTRAPGTRAPIHEHEFSGTTTVVQGEMTLFMEGHPPVRAVQGESYFMPPGHKMTGVNTGPGDAILFHSYILPPYARHWRPLEPGFVKCLDEKDTRH